MFNLLQKVCTLSFLTALNDADNTTSMIGRFKNIIKSKYHVYNQSMSQLLFKLSNGIFEIVYEVELSPLQQDKARLQHFSPRIQANVVNHVRCVKFQHLHATFVDKIFTINIGIFLFEINLFCIG